MSEPIPSATVVLLRDAPAGLEILLLRRHSDIAYGGSWVFPGGRIDGEEFTSAGEDALAAARLAAVRETREEAGLTVTGEQLVYFAHWTTPVIRPKRFSTWFFLAPAGSDGVAIDGGEIQDFAWHTAASALQAQRSGDIELPPPTFVTLTQLQPYADVAAALAHFRAREPVKIQPKVTKTPAGVVYLYDDDAGYADMNPEAPGARHRLLQPVDGAWEYLAAF
jgi:8-oxo-dGTP pyrophosphatase MutT (NUDIX family)